MCSDISIDACTWAMRGSVSYVSGWGPARLVDLPGQWGAKARVLGQQAVEDRGPGTRLPDDEDRRSIFPFATSG